MEVKEGVQERLEAQKKLDEVKEAIDFLLWKIDRAGPNIRAYIDTIDLQAIRVVQKVKALKDALE